MGAAIYRGIDPFDKSYAELQFIDRWSRIIDNELERAMNA